MEIVTCEVSCYTKVAVFDVVTGEREFLSEDFGQSVAEIYAVPAVVGGPSAAVVHLSGDRTFLLLNDLVVSAVPSSAIDLGALTANVPNPFRLATDLTFTLSQPSRVTISIFDVGGRLLRQFDYDRVEAGVRHTSWDGLDRDGHKVPSGTYVYSLSVDGQIRDAGKAILAR